MSDEPIMLPKAQSIITQFERFERYVNGFLFEAEGVWLILKNRPKWQAGRLNGIGGHIEPGEDPLRAMIREFREETGVATTQDDWSHFATLRGEGFEVWFYCARIGPLMTRPRRMETEEIVLMRLSDVTAENCIPNLTWLIPMALSMQFERTRMFAVREGAWR